MIGTSPYTLSMSCATLYQEMKMLFISRAIGSNDPIALNIFRLIADGQEVSTKKMILTK
jgi:hypothetical protein